MGRILSVRLGGVCDGSVMVLIGCCRMKVC